MKNKIIEFVRQKDYKFLEEIGQGGTGRTVLLKDEMINETFVCKKYSPISSEVREKYYDNFIEEIKILHLLYHKNIVRVFNYYLYPEELTGYILMEYIQGLKISDFIKDNPDKLNDIFIQTISGFEYLEKNNILHRDIRPENILITNEGLVKIIDFGFGHKKDYSTDFAKNISIHWRYSRPKEFDDQVYDNKTDIYFIGKLFEEIIIQNNYDNFDYPALLQKMIDVNYEKRINSFFIISREIIYSNKNKIEFTREEKSTYQEFADVISSIFSKLQNTSHYQTDINQIINDLEEVYKNSMLEEIIQNHRELSACFVYGQYRYFLKREIKVSTLYNFINFFKNSNKGKQKIILNNIWKRLDKIERITIFEEELPF